MSPATGTAAASSNEEFAGFNASLFSRAIAYSAKPPVDLPNTSSPGLNWVMLLATASTRPAMSVPSPGFFGLRKPSEVRAKNGAPLMLCQSRGFAEAA